MKSAAVLQHSTVFTALKHLYLCKGFKEDTFKKKKKLQEVRVYVYSNLCKQKLLTDLVKCACLCLLWQGLLFRLQVAVLLCTLKIHQLISAVPLKVLFTQPESGRLWSRLSTLRAVM